MVLEKKLTSYIDAEFEALSNGERTKLISPTENSLQLKDWNYRFKFWVLLRQKISGINFWRVKNHRKRMKLWGNVVLLVSDGILLLVFHYYRSEIPISLENCWLLPYWKYWWCIGSRSIPNPKHERPSPEVTSLWFLTFLDASNSFWNPRTTFLNQNLVEFELVLSLFPR